MGILALCYIEDLLYCNTIFFRLTAYLSLSGSGREVGWGGHLFKAGRLLTFSAFRMAAYLRWVLIRGWAPIRINTVFLFLVQLRNKYFIIQVLDSLLQSCF